MRAYLDHASTTPLRPEATAAITQWAERLGRPDGAGDPGRIHEEGRLVRDAIEVARDQLAGLLGVAASRVVFTSGATEAANTAVASAARAGGPILTSAVEHACVREPARRAGPVVELAVAPDGTVDLDDLERHLAGGGDRPALVCCQWANHELGTVQPVAEVAARCAAAGVPLLVDAAAAAGHLAIDLGRTPVDFFCLSGHKLGAPAGIGALVIGRSVRLTPLLSGGTEERARRAGAENVLGIVALGAVAAALGEPGRIEDEASVAAGRRDRLADAALGVDGVRLLGPAEPERRLPHLCCLEVPGVLGEAVLIGLDRAGVACHSGSACSSELFEPSPVLAAVGADPDRSLRLSVGWSTTGDDLAAFGVAFPRVVGELRALGRPASGPVIDD